MTRKTFKTTLGLLKPTNRKKGGGEHDEGDMKLEANLEISKEKWWNLMSKKSIFGFLWGIIATDIEWSFA